MALILSGSLIIFKLLSLRPFCPPGYFPIMRSVISASSFRLSCTDLISIFVTNAAKTRSTNVSRRYKGWPYLDSQSSFIRF